MRAFSIQMFGLKIKNTWVRDGLSEILATFILSIFVYASGALFTLSRGTSSSVMGRALASACGTTLAIYSGFNASGSCLNPGIALMFCLLDKIRWKKYPLYVVCEFIGAFLAACVTYSVYLEAFQKFDGGMRQIYGENATANIFTSIPADGFSKSSGFLEILVGAALLAGIVAAIIDANNAGPASGVLPIPMTLLLYAIAMTFSLQTGGAINANIDLGGRTFVAIAGWGPEVFSIGDYWFWVPPAGNIAGGIVGTFVYQLMVGQHLPQPYDTTIDPVKINVDIEGTKYKENSTELSIVNGKTNLSYIHEI
ncbi:hypothetical protein CHS0354_038889 [Potamilus streckersoni]|uniref:Aquaporin n=1 Tax=Potamilus streckersoni TaxID=2493646 RepID=A0AAE0SQH9_9BIVA|nr:hypothetical protein CHS0354_038889 [Potamilus streckersoni]